MTSIDQCASRTQNFSSQNVFFNFLRIFETKTWKFSAKAEQLNSQVEHFQNFYRRKCIFRERLESWSNMFSSQWSFFLIFHNFCWKEGGGGAVIWEKLFQKLIFEINPKIVTIEITLWKKVINKFSVTEGHLNFFYEFLKKNREFSRKIEKNFISNKLPKPISRFSASTVVNLWKKISHYWN